MSDNNQTPALILEYYEAYLSHRDEAKYFSEVARHYALPTLQRLARWGDSDRRRAAVVALGLMGDYDTNHVMGNALVDEDRTVRALAEEGIQSIWSRAGNSQQRGQLEIVSQLNEAKDYEAAVTQATQLIEQAPWFAEIWNQRAMAFFQIGRYSDSIRDCHQALEINPYHFAAATRMGECHLKLGDTVSALESFRRALRLNPNLEMVRAKVANLQRMLKGK